MYLNIFMMFEKFEIKKVYWFLANWPKKTKWYIIMTVVEETACFFFTFPTIFHYISWACFFNPERGIAEHAI